MIRTVVFVVLAGTGLLVAQPAPELRWYKGNTHTHTLNSDGDSTPDEVVRWYREHRYQFLVLTDHNFLTDVTALNALHGADEKFLVIRGAGGVPHINHPNYLWSIAADELKAVRNNRLFEIYNGHPQTNNAGGGGVPDLEAAWDRILSSNVLLYGIAVDDAHTFKDPGNPNVAGPGRGWVMVRAARLETRAILDALERGDFYASTGVVLEKYDVTAEGMTVAVRADAWSKYRMQFIGRDGRVLQEVPEARATYRFRGDEGYVRARVLESNGRVAWLQPSVIR